ncbi:shikimate kinase [bacterium]|nr:shikimate kinase [bacterium]
MRIYLTGFMGSGKSTVGRLLSEQTGLPFIDLDQEIEYKLSLSPAEVFERYGEPFFRNQETELLQKFQMDPLIIATGGGCFIHNREWMLQQGAVLFLDVPYAQLVSRLGADPTRPLWKNAEKLYTDRHEEYKKAHHTIDASGTPEQVVELIRALPLPGLKKTPES